MGQFTPECMPWIIFYLRTSLRPRMRTVAGWGVGRCEPEGMVVWVYLSWAWGHSVDESREECRRPAMAWQWLIFASSARLPYISASILEPRHNCYILSILTCTAWFKPLSIISLADSATWPCENPVQSFLKILKVRARAIVPALAVTHSILVSLHPNPNLSSVCHTPTNSHPNWPSIWLRLIYSARSDVQLTHALH